MQLLKFVINRKRIEPRSPLSLIKRSFPFFRTQESSEKIHSGCKMVLEPCFLDYLKNFYLVSIFSILNNQFNQKSLKTRVAKN